MSALDVDKARDYCLITTNNVRGTFVNEPVLAAADEVSAPTANKRDMWVRMESCHAPVRGRRHGVSVQTMTVTTTTTTTTTTTATMTITMTTTKIAFSSNQSSSDALWCHKHVNDPRLRC